MSDEPSPREERVLLSLFRRATMRQHEPAPGPAAHHEPFGIVREAGGILAARHHPRPAPRGVVLFAHAPAHDPRIAFANALGLAAMSFEHGGHGESDEPAGFYHHEWRDALRWARRRHPGVPIHVWGVSTAGYFAHHALARDEEGVATAVFEDVPTEPPFGSAASARAFLLTPGARRWLAAHAHAPRMAAEHVLYVSGGRDAQARESTARLAEAAGPFARHHIVADAGHGEAWAKGGDALRGAIERMLAGA